MISREELTIIRDREHLVLQSLNMVDLYLQFSTCLCHIPFFHPEAVLADPGASGKGASFPTILRILC